MRDVLCHRESQRLHPPTEELESERAPIDMYTRPYWPGSEWAPQEAAATCVPLDHTCWLQGGLIAAQVSAANQGIDPGEPPGVARWDFPLLRRSR